ncbi:flippase [Candidatus Uhrbacteria bacterium]|nr:flippase [Candidatus Uhrbacteria bacterium]
MSEHKVAKNTAYLMTAFIGQKVLAFVYFAIVARSFGVEGAGRYFLAVSFATVFAVFLDLGLSNVIIRETAKRPEDAQKLLAVAMGVKAAMSGIVFALTNGIAWVMAYPGETRLMILIASLVMSVDTLNLAWYGVMRGRQNLKYEAVGVVVGQAVSLAFGGMFVLMGMSLPWLVVALLLNTVWNGIWAFVNLKRHFGLEPLRFSWDRQVLRFFWGVTIPFALAGIFARVYSYIDSIMLSKLADDAAVGSYGVGYKITFSFQCLAMAFAAAMYPAMSAACVRERDRLPGLLTASVKYLLLVAAPIVTGIFVLAGPLIRTIYGPGFDGAIRPLQVLIFSLVFAFLYWPVGSLLNAADRQRENTAVMGATMVLNVALNAILLPDLGAVGAAWASVASNALLFFAALTVSGYRVVPVETLRILNSAWRIVAASVLMGGLVRLGEGHLPLPALVAIGVAAYPSAILALRAVTWREARSLVSVLGHRGKAVSDLPI